MDIRYKCISNKVPGFIAPEETGSTEPGITYLSHYPDNYCNVFVCPVLQHHVIGRYFSACIPIYNNDRMRHFYLALEKYWVIQRGYFRLATILVLGMGIIYGKILFCHVISYQSTVKNISIRECNNRTVYNCFKSPFSPDCGIPDLDLPFIPIDDSPHPNKNPGITLVCLQITFLLPL